MMTNKFLALLFGAVLLTGLSFSALAEEDPFDKSHKACKINRSGCLRIVNPPAGLLLRTYINHRGKLAERIMEINGWQDKSVLDMEIPAGKDFRIVGM